MSKTDVNMEAKELPRTGTNGGGGGASCRRVKTLLRERERPETEKEGSLASWAQALRYPTIPGYHEVTPYSADAPSFCIS